MHPPNSCHEAEDILMDCVHDLRQPLTTIETSVFVLSLLLADSTGKVPEQLRTIERQVELAARTLDQAVTQLRRLRSESMEAGGRAFAESEAVAAR
jgi:signal transduction histidine kinase